MKSENIILIALLIILVGGLGYAITGFSKANPIETQSKTKFIENNNQIQESNTKSSSGKVSIDLTPREYLNGKFYVDGDFNTHSGALEDYNLKELVILKFNGKELSPISVPELSWHHGSGTFIFELNNEPKEFDIIITGIPDIEERVFSWT